MSPEMLKALCMLFRAIVKEEIADALGRDSLHEGIQVTELGVDFLKEYGL